MGLPRSTVCSRKATRPVLGQQCAINARLGQSPTILSNFQHIRQANVVLHSNLNVGSRGAFLSAMLGGDLPEQIPNSPELDMISTEPTPSAAFAHHKVKTLTGTILLFNSMHAIRSGGASHACAIISLLKFVNYLRKLHPDTHGAIWVQAASIPNSVFCGQFTHRLSESFRESARATYTSKFPGIAVSLSNTDRITPEVFLKEAKFILPGVKTAVSLHKSLTELALAAQPYMTSITIP